MTIQTGYAIANLSAIKALTPTQRTDGYTRQAQSDASGNPAWYTFLASSTASADNDLVLLPLDNPPTGRWHKNGGAGGGAAFGGLIICTNGCTTAAGGSGKALQFYAAHSNLKLIIQIGFEINIQVGSQAIAIYRWSQEPNTSMTGRESTPIVELSEDGGGFNITIDSTYRWITIFAKNPANGNYLDGVCFVTNGNVITLLGYS